MRICSVSQGEFLLDFKLLKGLWIVYGLMLSFLSPLIQSNYLHKFYRWNASNATANYD